MAEYFTPEDSQKALLNAATLDDVIEGEVGQPVTSPNGREFKTLATFDAMYQEVIDTAQEQVLNQGFVARVYDTPSDGVAAGTGVPNGKYFNARSSDPAIYAVEYLNNNGTAQATGKTYPTLQAWTDALAAVTSTGDSKVAAINTLASQKTTDLTALGDTKIADVAATGEAKKAQLNEIAAAVSGLNSGMEFYEAQTTLLASSPSAAIKVAKALDTKKVWLWKKPDSNPGTWTDTGLSELDQAKGYSDANALFKPVTLASGQYTNIDQMTTPGHYIIDNNTIAAAITGLPEAKAGFIDVISKSGFVTQEYRPSASSYRYIRTSSVAGAFPMFEKIVGQPYIDASVATAKQTIQDDLTVEGSKNLFNVATVRSGYRLSSSGAVIAVANAKCSDYIPIDGGENYTISATSRPTGVSFFADRTGSSALLYSAASNNPLTLTAPATARFMVINVKREADSGDAINLQVEKGSNATAYTAYSAKSVLRNSTLPSNVVTTANAAVASIKPYDIYSVSKNLFAESNIVTNSYLSNTGNVNASTGWVRSGMIPVTPGQTYTLSGTRNRHGLSWFASSTDITTLAYVPDTGLPLTVTAPAGANFVSFNLQTSTATGWSNIQFEQGSSATTYIPYGQVKFQIDGSAIVNVPAPTVAALGTFTGGTIQQTIKGVQGTDTILHTVTMTKAATHAGSRVFNWVSTALNGLVLHTCGDDAAPFRINGTTLGGNHGYSRTILTAASHGKTLVDVGSVWKDAANKEWVIVSIDSTGTLAVTARTDNTAISAPSGTLTRDGAVSINWTGVSAQQWYPMLKNHKVSITADGKPIDPTSTTPIQFDKLIIAQSYELMPKNNMVEWLIAHAGSSTDFTEYQAASNVSVSMAYTFDRYGNCTFATDFLALDTVTLTSSGNAPIMFHQTARLTPAVDGNVYYYMPNALPLVHEDVTYDFANKADVSNYAPTGRLNMTLDRVASGKSINRVVQLTNNWFYASGFLPILDAAPAVRNTLASNKALQLNEDQAKIYFSAYDNGATTMAAGEYRSMIAYRNYGRRPAERTDNYAVPSRQGDFYYMDWHAATTDRISLPAEYQGRAFTVHDKSSSVTVLGLNESGVGSATNSVTCKTTGSGYAVLKFL